MKVNSGTLKPQEAILRLEEVQDKIAFIADAVISWPEKSIDPDDTVIMGAVSLFKDIIEQIDEIGEAFQKYLNKTK